MVTGGRYTCGEPSLLDRVVESVCCTPETNTICVNYTSVKKIKTYRSDHAFVKYVSEKKKGNGVVV